MMVDDGENWNPYIYVNEREKFVVLWANETSGYSYYYRSEFNITSLSFSEKQFCFETINPDTGFPSTIGKNEMIGNNEFSLSYNDVTIGSIVYIDSTVTGWFFIDTEGSFTPPSSSFQEPTEIKNEANLWNQTYDNEYGYWLFKGEKYSISYNISNTVNESYIELKDYEHIIRFWRIDKSRYNTTIIGGRTFDKDNVARLISVEETECGNYTCITMNFILGENIIDVQKRNVAYGYYENNTLTTKETSLKYSIYNLGNIMEYEFINDASRISGGDVFEIQSQYNGTFSTAEAKMKIRRLQHVKLQYSLNVPNVVYDTQENTGKVIMGIRALINQSWVDLMYSSYYIAKGAVDSGGSGSGKAFVILNNIWYARDKNGTVSAIKDGELLSAYPDCGDDVTSNVQTMKMWFDVWFNKANSSTIIGGRINSYYYGMEEGGFMLWTNWKPVESNNTYSMGFTDLRNPNGNVIPCSIIELMEFYVKLETASSGDTNLWKLTDYQIVEIRKAQDRMQGINTPDYEPTKIIDMPSGGFVAPIVTAIQSIGSLIWSGAFTFMKIIVVSIDSFLVWFGLPDGLFSSLLNFIMISSITIFSWIETMIEYTVQILSIFTQLINGLLAYIDYIISGIVWLIVWVLPIPIHVITFLVAIITSGTWTYMGYTWDFSQWSDITNAFWEIAPYWISFMFVTWLFFGKSGDDFEGFPNRIIYTFKIIKEGYSSIFWIFNRMRNEIMSLYNFIKSHIPFLSGSGGGETEE